MASSAKRFSYGPKDQNAVVAAAVVQLFLQPDQKSPTQVRRQVAGPGFIVRIWILGVCGTLDLNQRDLFVASNDAGIPATSSCGKQIDPWIYPLDVMIPLNLGEESRFVPRSNWLANQIYG